MTIFNHHHRALPPTCVTEFTHQSRQDALHAIASILALEPDYLQNTPTQSGTFIQALLSAERGGIGFDDPVLNQPPTFLGGWADACPALRLDHRIGHIIADPLNWINQPSLTLQQAALTFDMMVSLPAFKCPTPLDEPRNAREALVDPTTGRPCITRLHLTSQRHPQRTFSNIARDTAEASYLGPLSLIAAEGKARIRACALPPSPCLFQMYGTTPLTTLNDLQLTFLVCFRLGIPLPFLAPPLTCHHRCKLLATITAATPADPIFYALIRGYHHAACKCGGYSIARHNEIAHVIAEIASAESGYTTHLQSFLSSSLTDGKQVDIIMSSWRLGHTIAMDTTLSNPLLVSYVKAASLSASAIITEREEEKDKKHLLGCLATDRIFIPAVFTTFGGMGGDRFNRWFNSLFEHAIAAEKLEGGTGWAATRRKQLAIQRFCAVIARATASMVENLARGVPRSDRGSKRPRTAPTPAANAGTRF